MGWGTFLIAYVTLAVTLFCPGYLALRSLRLSRQNAVCLAPAVTILSLLVMGVAYTAVGVHAGFALMVLPPLALFLALFLVRHPWRDAGTEDGARSWLPLLVYITAGVVMVFIFFCGNLEGNLAAFQPDNDNAFHLSLIKSIADSGRYSILHASVYAASDMPPFTGNGSFYPAAFHCIAALVVNLYNLSIPLAENALAAVIASLIWPTAVYWAMVHIFPKNRVAMYAGAVTCMLMDAFPWRFFIWGPLFPNMLSLAMVPAAAGTFMELADSLARRSGRRLQLFLFVVSLGAVATAHPNGVFTLAVLLVPYMVSFICNSPDGIGRHRSRDTRSRVLASLAFLVVAVALWIGVCLLPALKSVVTFPWGAYQDFGMGLLSAISLKLSGNRAQSILAILLIVGLVGSLRKWRQYSWIAGLFAFTAVQFATSTSVMGIVRQLLVGFWYTDPNRIAANVALAAIPLTALGASEVLTLAQHVLKSREEPSENVAMGLTLTMLAVLVGASVLAHASEQEEGFQLPTTASFDLSSMIEYKYSDKTDKAYDKTEQAFVDKVLQTVPKGTLLLNLPNDGSCFAYTLQDANVFYKDVTSPDIYAPGQKEAARIIRRNLCRISTMDTVQEAARSLNIHYLLLLDKGVAIQKDNQTLPEYHSNDWRGIIGVTDDTPGFEIVLAEGDMRLYKIDY